MSEEKALGKQQKEGEEMENLDENWIFSEDVPHQVETKDLKPVS